jgi:hypothetical protein
MRSCIQAAESIATAGMARALLWWLPEATEMANETLLQETNRVAAPLVDLSNHPGPRAIGAAGLVAFSKRGKVRFPYDAAAAGTDSICDAYAMNVAGNGEVWVHFYNMERARESMKRIGVNAIVENSSCKRKPRPYIRPYTAMLRTTGHIESHTTRLGVSVAVYPCAAEQGSLPKFGMLPRRLDWERAGP